MKKFITLLLFNFLMLSLAVLPVVAQQTYYYDFRNTLNEVSGTGPALNVLGTGAFVNEGLSELSCVSRPVYGFTQNSGVQFDNDAAGNFLGATYSIEMYFQFLNNAGFKRIIDFKDRTVDSGLYCTAAILQFYDAITINTTQFTANQYVHLVVTRDDANDQVKLYVDGTEIGSFFDTGDLGVLDTSNVLNFFQDDLVFGGEAGPGRIALLKLSDFSMDSTQVADAFSGLEATSNVLSFTADINASCLIGNVFNFTNTSVNAGGNTYTWEFGDGNFSTDTNATYSYTTAGTYTVLLIADNGAGCIDTASTEVTVYSSAPVNLGPDQNICDGSSAILDAGDDFTSYLWNTTATSSSITVTTGGTYIVEVIDTLGCAGSDTVVVNVLSYPVVELGNDTTLCFGESLTLTAPSGQTSYVWSTGDTTETIVVTADGIYAVEVANIAGCSTTDTINVNFQPEIQISLGADTTFCFGLTYTLDPGDGFSGYEWSDLSTDSTLAVTASGTYSVIVTEASGCTATDSVEVTVLAPVLVDLGSDSTFCGGTPVEMDAGSGFAGYLWNDGSQNQTLTVTTGGVYTVTVTDNNNCTGTDSVTLTATPLVSLGPDQIWCVGVLTTLDPGSGFASYLWSDGSSAQTLDVTTSGIYTVTVSDGSGCVNSDVINVTFNTVPVFDLGPPFDICDGQAALLDPGPGYMSYQWSDGSSDQVLAVTTAGTYWVLVSSAPNCDASDTITISVLPAPSMTLGSDTTLCEGDTLTLDAGAGFSGYLWSDGSSGTTLDVTTSDMYIATVTGSNGCETTDSVIVFFDAYPLVDLGLDQEFCSGNIAFLDAGSGPYTYQWQDGSNSQFYNASSTGNYMVTVTSPAGCSTTDDVNINVFDNPIVNLGLDTTLCDGASIELDAVIPGDYLWNNGSITQTITVTVAATYTVTVTDGNGCAGTDDIIVDFAAPVPTPTITQNINTLQSSSPTGNQWYSNPGGLIPGATGQDYSPGANGTFYVIVTDANGCVSDTSAEYIFVFDALPGEVSVQLSLVPNPANNTVTLTTSGIPSGSLKIEMFDIIGKTVLTQEVLATGKHQLNVSEYPEGLYFIKVSSGAYQSMKRLVINR